MHIRPFLLYLPFVWVTCLSWAEGVRSADAIYLGCIRSSSDNAQPQDMAVRAECNGQENGNLAQACLAMHSNSDPNALKSKCENYVGGICATDNYKMSGCEKYASGAPVVPEIGSKSARPRPDGGPAKSTNPRATTPARNTTNTRDNPSAPANVQEPNQAQYTAQNDLSSCQGEQQNAQTCCTRPDSCVGGTAGSMTAGGLQAYCQQMAAAGNTGATASNNAAANCHNRHTSCQNTCEQMITKYQSLVSSCGSCSSLSIYTQTLNQLNQAKNTCAGYASLVRTLGTQAVNSANGQGSGNICQQMSQASPQSTPGSSGGQDPTSQSTNSNDPYGCQQNPNSAGCQQCATNPNSPACRALAYEKEVKGEASFSADTKEPTSKGNDFNVSDPSGSTNYAGNAEDFKPASVKNGTIANNAGGGIPGGGGGAPAQLGGARGGGSPGSPGYTTDVLQGFNGAGGYSAAAGQDAGTNGDGAGYGQGGGRIPATDQNGVDLRRFLPGGDKDPLRRKVGGVDLYAGQINGKFVNIWNRISDRMQEKCRLGELIGCQ